jgi:hypothetical protein
MRTSLSICMVLAVSAFAGVAAADPDVRVVVTGVVEFNAFTTGTYAGIPAGTPVTMTIDLDSTDYLDRPNLPGVTRGYRFYPNTFSLTIGTDTRSLRTVPVTLPAYFVLRNNDPRADGFFISQGTDIDTHLPLNMVPNNYGIAFSRTFDSIPPTPPGGPDPTLQNLNIRDALGSWGFDNLAVYHFAIEVSEFSVPMLIAYQTITVSLLCDSIDFNNDGLFPDTQDIDDFLSVFSGGTCSNDPNCNDVDFNNDGLFPDTLDIDALLSVFIGGGCLG